MTQKKHQARLLLREAADSLCDEVWEGLWNHLPEMHGVPIAEHREILVELERRCPGYTPSEYQEAYCRSLLTRR